MKLVEGLKVLKPNTQQLTIKDEIPKNKLNENTKIELSKIKEIGETVNR